MRLPLTAVHELPSRSPTMPEFLLIKTSSLGDVIHQMPAVTELRRHCPQARVSWLVEEAFAPLLRLHPAVDVVVPVAARRWRKQWHRGSTWRQMRELTARLRAQPYDAIVDTQGLFRTALMARLARGPRHGYDARSVREPPAARLYDVQHRVRRDLHAIERNGILTALALGYQRDHGLDFGLDRARLAPPAERPYAVFLHATARAAKEWPEDSWIELGRLLSARGIELRLPWGSPAERDRSARIARALDSARVPEQAPLDAMARLIAGASFVIGVDTGLLHLAAALAVPLVGVFVASEPGLTGPMGAGPIAVLGGQGLRPSAREVAAALDRVIR
jgi:heptosyltransferase I